MVRKKTYNITELKRQIRCTQLMQIKTKLTIKIIKSQSAWDFQIDPFELPIELYHHKLSINLSLLKGTLLVQIWESKSLKLINEGIITAREGVFTDHIYFYTDQRFVNITFKLKGKSLNQTYYIHKLGIDSDIDPLYTLPYQRKLEDVAELKYASIDGSDHIRGSDLKSDHIHGSDLKSDHIPEIDQNDLTKFLDSDLWNNVTLINFSPGNTLEEDFCKMETQRDKYLNLLSGLTSMFLTSTSLGPMIFYNLCYFLRNQKKGPLKENKGFYQEAQISVIKARISQNDNKMTEYITKYYDSTTSRTKLHETLIETRESYDNYRIQFINNLDDLRQILSKQSTFSKRDKAISRSESDLQKLNVLKGELLSELNKVKTIQQIFIPIFNKHIIDKPNEPSGSPGKSGSNKDDKLREQFIGQFMSLINGLYKELGKDILLIDDKMQDYKDVLGYIKNEMNDSALYQERKTLEENTQKNHKRIVILKERFHDLQEKIHIHYVNQYQTILALISMKVENNLLKELLF